MAIHFWTEKSSQHHDPPQNSWFTRIAVVWKCAVSLSMGSVSNQPRTLLCTLNGLNKSPNSPAVSWTVARLLCYLLVANKAGHLQGVVSHQGISLPSVLTLVPTEVTCLLTEKGSCLSVWGSHNTGDHCTWLNNYCCALCIIIQPLLYTVHNCRTSIVHCAHIATMVHCA